MDSHNCLLSVTVPLAEAGSSRSPFGFTGRPIVLLS